MAVIDDLKLIEVKITDRLNTILGNIDTIETNNQAALALLDELKTRERKVREALHRVQRSIKALEGETIP